MAVRRLEFRILGPLVVRSDGAAVAVGGPKQRALLALLLLSANRVVSRDTLIRELFADLGVNSADHALRNQVSRLRKALAPGAADEPRLVARAPGYLLRVEPGELDLDRFETLAEEGREALAAGDPATAAAVLQSAEALWTGRPLADLEFEPFARVDVERLEELRLAALENRLDADLAAGRHVALVAELEPLTEEYPYRERFRAQLMLALYRAGRQAEGLEVYRRTRELLNDELGLEPGVQLQQLERAILVQDSALELPPDSRPRRRRMPTDTCPYKGLAPFEAGDAELFFGRERLVDELLARLDETSLLAIIGPSGSGKSSLLRAGLVPAIGGDAIVVRPGDAGELAAALERVPPDGRIVLAVDQFEELFALPEGERRALADVLVDAAWDPERRAVVLLALRADFFGRLAEHVALADLVGPNHVLLGPMTASELRRAIEQPAERTGLTVEPALVDALVDDVAGEAGGLPLLSTALLDLWREREEHTLTRAAYERSGGVRGAVGRHAEAAFLSLDEDDRRIAQRILVRLVAGGDGEPFTRRRAARTELDAADERVLEALVARRLLVASGDQVELVHEALLERWPRLADWLDEDAHGRRLHAHLARTAADWETSGRDPGELYRGARLAAAAEWADAAGPDAVNRLEHEFLSESRAAFARANRRLRTLLAVAVLLLVLALLAGGVALAARGSARSRATDAVAERLGAQALVDPELDRSLLLAREGTNLHDSETTRSDLLADLLRSPAAVGIARPGGDRLLDEALSPDGRTLAVRGDNGVVVFFDARTLRRVGTPVAGSSQIGLVSAEGGPLRDLAFSPDGAALAVGSSDGHVGTLDLVSRASQTARRLTSGSSLLIADVAFSPDGRTVATGEPADGFDEPRPETIVLHDRRTGKELHRSLGIPGGRLAGYTRDGLRLLVTEGPRRSILLDARTLDRVRALTVGGVAAVSAATDAAAFGHGDGSVTLVDLQTGAARHFRGHADGAIDAVAFARDGGTLATTTESGSVATWSVRAGELRDTFTGHSGAAIAAVFGADGRTLYTASTDGTLIAWDIDGARRLGRPFTYAGQEDHANASAVDPDGSLVAVSRAANSVALLDARTLRPPGRTFTASIGDVSSISFSGDGALVAATGATGAAIWNVQTGERLTTTTVGPHGSTDVAFSSDRRMLAVGEADNAVKLVDIRTRKIRVLPSVGTPGDVDFSPDGRLLATASLNGTVTLWDVATQRALRSLTGAAVAAFAVAFSPDGKLLAVGDNSGTVVLWDAARGVRTGTPLVAHNGGVGSLAFSPDGRILATSEFDGDVRLWDVASRKLIGAPLPTGGGAGPVAFFPDGKHLLATPDPGIAMLWPVDPAAWEARACSVAGRELTRAEWADFLGGRAYRDVCPRRA